MVYNRLKEIRMKVYMMNQKEFSALLGLDYRQYNRYEHGINPDLEVALRMAQKLNLKIEDIFSLSE